MGNECASKSGKLMQQGRMGNECGKEGREMNGARKDGKLMQQGRMGNEYSQEG